MAKTINEKVRDSVLRHALAKQKASDRIITAMLELISALERDLKAQLRAASTDWKRSRVNAMLKEMDRLITATGAAMEQRAEALLDPFAEGEIKFAASNIRYGSLKLIAVKSVALEKILAVAKTNPFNGRIMRDWFKSWAVGTREAVRQQVMIGYVDGETITQIRNRILGAASERVLIGRSIVGKRRPRQRLTSRMLVARRNAATIARTAVNHYSETAHQLVWEANADIIKGVQWVSTLDDRTSNICQERDGQFYKLGEGPRPPAHPNCRSKMIPVMKSWRELGIDRDELPPSTRASADGQVPATLTYAQWQAQRNQP